MKTFANKICLLNQNKKILNLVIFIKQCFQGEKGTKGDSGPMGLPGPIGFRGESGPVGPNGKAGKNLFEKIMSFLAT